MKTADYLSRISEYTQQSLTRLSTDDPEENRIRGLYPEARYRAPHPIYYLMESLLGLGLSQNAEEIQLLPDAQGFTIFLKTKNEIAEVSTLPKSLQVALTDRFKDSAGLKLGERSGSQNGIFHVQWQDEKYIMPIAFTPALHGDQIAFHFEPQTG